MIFFKGGVFFNANTIKDEYGNGTNIFRKCYSPGLILTEDGGGCGEQSGGPIAQ